MLGGHSVYSYNNAVNGLKKRVQAINWEYYYVIPFIMSLSILSG